MQLLEYKLWCAVHGISLVLSVEDLQVRVEEDETDSLKLFADKTPPTCVDGVVVEDCEDTSMCV